MYENKQQQQTAVLAAVDTGEYDVQRSVDGQQQHAARFLGFFSGHDGSLPAGMYKKMPCFFYKKHSTSRREREQKSFVAKRGFSRCYNGFFAIFPPFRG